MNPISNAASMINASSLIAESGALANSPLASSLLTEASTGSLSGSTSQTLSGLIDVENVGDEFEAVFLSLMLKEMRNTLDSENGGLFAGEGSDTFGGMFDMFMSQHMAKSQPLGIGEAIRGYMTNQPEGDAS